MNNIGKLVVLVVLALPPIVLIHSNQAQGNAPISPHKHDAIQHPHRLTVPTQESHRPQFKAESISTTAEEAEFLALRQVLEQHGFKVRLASPPQQRAYGLLNTQSKTVWINPVVFELGIALPTLVHETVHAAQLCVSREPLRPIGLGISPPPIAWPYFTRYHSYYQRAVEAEAYAVQTQPNNVALATSLVQKYC